MTSDSIFIASNTNNVWSSETFSPKITFRFTMFPGVGAEISVTLFKLSIGFEFSNVVETSCDEDDSPSITLTL